MHINLFKKIIRKIMNLERRCKQPEMMNLPMGLVCEIVPYLTDKADEIVKFFDFNKKLLHRTNLWKNITIRDIEYFCYPIESIKVYGFSEISKELSKLRYPHIITHLILHSEKVDYCKKLHFSRSLRRLRGLQLFNQISRLSNLTHLKVLCSYFEVRDDDLKNLSNLTHQTLVDCNSISNEGIKYLSNLTHLELMLYCGCPFDYHNNIDEGLKHLPNLIHLKLGTLKHGFSLIVLLVLKE